MVKEQLLHWKKAMISVNWHSSTMLQGMSQLVPLLQFFFCSVFVSVSCSFCFSFSLYLSCQFFVWLCLFVRMPTIIIKIWLIWKYMVIASAVIAFRAQKRRPTRIDDNGQLHSHINFWTVTTWRTVRDRRWTQYTYKLNYEKKKKMNEWNEKLWKQTEEKSGKCASYFVIHFQVLQNFQINSHLIQRNIIIFGPWISRQLFKLDMSSGLLYHWEWMNWCEKFANRWRSCIALIFNLSLQIGTLCLRK